LIQLQANQRPSEKNRSGPVYSRDGHGVCHRRLYTNERAGERRSCAQ
jgi:hypothetical protein